MSSIIKSTNSLNNKELVMEFDPNTIEHLGINQYSTLPPVIAELVANSYDADSKEVIIKVNDAENKEILVSDNGHGMLFDQINEKFLRIGRNRREEDNSQKSESGKRLVIGKKGIGKLSFFGIARSIEITTIRNYIENKFLMDLDKLKEAGKKRRDYKPQVISNNVKSKIEQGTLVRMYNIKRKSPYSPEDIAYSLAKYFCIFDEPDFNVTIIHNNDEENKITVNNKMRYSFVKTEFKWSFPLKNNNIDYEYKDLITGEIVSSKETIPSNFEGIALFSRGKLVNDHSFFDVKSSSHGYKYITGWLNIDFIDNWDKEVISTNRKSLNWEDEDTIILKDYLNQIIYFVYNEQRRRREEKKKTEIEKVTGISLEKWINDLPSHERSLANKMVNIIIKSENVDVEKAGELIHFVKDSFQFESFKELASDLDKVKEVRTDKLIELFKEWELIEAREFYKLSTVRIETIKKFEVYIKENAREVPIMHNFLKQFPWLLDPRIMSFKDEVTYSSLLKSKFKENKTPIEDRRIDFLCVDFSESLFIIELKRPRSSIGKKELLQAVDYVAFIKNKIGNEFSKSVCCYIVGEKFTNTDAVKTISNSLKNDRVVYLKSYTELLNNAKKYHQEFIDKYEKIQKRSR